MTQLRKMMPNLRLAGTNPTRINPPLSGWPTSREKDERPMTRQITAR